MSAAGSSLPHVGSPVRSSSTSRGAPPTVFLSRASAAQAASRSTLHGLRVELLAHGRQGLVVARELQRRDHSERDGLPVREVVAGRGLEGVAERVTEVELVARAMVMGISDANRLP